MHRTSLLFVLPLAVAAASAYGQVTSTSELVGWSTSLMSTAGQVDMQDADNNCQPARRVCAGVLTASNVSYAGGTAYDARHQSVWISDGTTIEEWSLATCTKLCSFKAQIMDSNAVVTGLAVVVGERRLLQLESTAGYAGLRSYDISQCPPNPLRDGCSVKLQSNAVAAGLACDEVRKLVYFTESAPALVGFMSYLHVSKSTDKCTTTRYGIKGCQSGSQGWGVVTGAAYNPASQRFYATDGQRTALMLLTDPLNGVFTHLTCCDRQIAADYKGLAVVPGWKQGKVGKSCLPQGCTPCGSMAGLLIGGDPALGNPEFGFRIEQGPAGQYTFLVLGASCSSGLKLPFLCEPLYPPLVPTPILSPPVLLQGSGCGGYFEMTLAIPADRGLCGLGLCAQWIVLCGTGLGATNGIDFTLGI